MSTALLQTADVDEFYETPTPAPMSVEGFLVELRRIRTKLSWVGVIKEQYRGEPVLGCLVIRGQLKGGSVFCPLTAVAAEKTGVRHPMSEYLRAAAVIGMAADEALMIAEAADAPITHNMELIDLHRQILEAVGL